MVNKLMRMKLADEKIAPILGRKTLAQKQQDLRQTKQSPLRKQQEAYGKKHSVVESINKNSIEYMTQKSNSQDSASMKISD